MTEAEWLACDDVASLLKHLDEKPSARKFRLWACACCRMIFAWLVDSRSRAAVEVAEGYADGLRSEAELKKADRRAERAADVLGGPPACAAMWAAHDKPDYYTCAELADDVARSFGDRGSGELIDARRRLAHLAREVFGNPSHPVAPASLLHFPVLSIALAAYEERALPSGHLDNARLLVLSDALEEAGCTDADILSHLRSVGPHVRGCWALDFVLAKN
jgi:hypothetical protein